MIGTGLLVLSDPTRQADFPLPECPLDLLDDSLTVNLVSRCANSYSALRLLMLLGLALGAMGCAESRPDFDIDAAHRELAGAFSREPAAVAILGDSRGSAEAEWLVDFTLDGFDPFLQARFEGSQHAWRLATVRERPRDGQDTPWTEVGVMLGRFRGAVIERAKETEKRMHDIAALVERYSVEHDHRAPNTNLDGVRKLSLESGYLEEGKWAFSSDAWGSAIAYHAAADGQSYILVSPGADGRWDIGLDVYFSNTDAGIEIYGGPSNDANADFVWASGSFVQVYRSE